MRRKRSPTKVPSLLILVPCLRAIIDQDDNLVSVIDILQDLTLSLSDPDLAKPKQKKFTAIPWHIFTLWRRTEPKTATFVQTIQIIAPKGKKLLDHDIEFSTTKPTYRIRLRNNGFPVTIAGEYLIKAFIRDKAAKRKRAVGQYPLNVVFSDQAPAEQAKQ